MKYIQKKIIVENTSQRKSIVNLISIRTKLNQSGFIFEKHQKQNQSGVHWLGHWVH
jgi:hypothetical protein